MLRALSARMAAPLGTRGAHAEAKYPWIGNREIVGYGYNGVPNYADRAEFPMPAIRWKEPTPDIVVRFNHSNLFCAILNYFVHSKLFCISSKILFVKKQHP